MNAAILPGGFPAPAPDAYAAAQFAGLAHLERIALEQAAATARTPPLTSPGLAAGDQLAVPEAEMKRTERPGAPQIGEKMSHRKTPAWFRRRVLGVPLAAAALAAAAVIALAATPALSAARPATVTGGGHACSYTNPEYMLSDWDMAVTTRPGTTWFRAVHAGSRYTDAYWITGWHNENSRICDNRELPGTRGLYGQSYTLRYKVSRHPRITADLAEHGTRGVRLGFDIWLTANPAETTPTEMEHDPRTWEILIQPGHGAIAGGHIRWHRWYLSLLPGRDGTVSVRGLNLSRIIARLHVPGSDYWMEIGAGGETPSGSFTVDRYALHIAGQYPMAWPHMQVATHPILTRGRPS